MLHCICIESEIEMFSTGDLVKFIPAADRNTSGWHPDRKVGLVVESFMLAGKLWYLIKFGGSIERVFHKDVELVNACR